MYLTVMVTFRSLIGTVRVVGTEQGNEKWILLTVQSIYEYGLTVCNGFPIDVEGLRGTTIGVFNRNGDLQVFIGNVSKVGTEQGIKKWILLLVQSI